MRRASSHAGRLRVPAHAGGLRAQERMVFGLIFGLMAAFVAAVTVSAAKTRNNAAVPSGVPGAIVSGGSTARPGATRANPNKQLAVALRSEARIGRGTLAVGVINITTGCQAVYNANLRFRTGSLVTADILATLLLQYQREGSSATARDTTLATEMIENSSDAAASTLSRRIGGAARIATANRTLKLTHTSLGTDGRWALTRTTVGDQLQLLTDLTSATSPLDAASRAYAVSLMEGVAPDQRWGISAAASPGTRYALRNGWLQDRLMIVDSMGIVRRNGQELLIVVLSSDNATKAGGIARAEAAALAAARVATAG